MDKLFLTILNMSLIGAFIIALICLVRLPLKKAPKIISYCLWAVVGFRLVFPFSMESVFSLIPFKARTIPLDIAMQPVPRIDSGIPFINNSVSSILPRATQTASMNPLQLWTAIGAFIWLTGAALMLIYGLVSFAILKGKMREAAHTRANIYETENIKMPFVLGIFQPKIYLPTGLSAQEKSYILLHEQTHIRRRDHLIKFGAYFILCLHWFNPLVWVAFLLMGVDMELSCDERVLKEIGGEMKKNYSMTLLSMASERRIIGGSPLAFGEGGVKERIKNVLNFKKPSRVITIISVALVAVLSVGFAANRDTDRSIADLLVPMSMNNVHKEPHFAGTVTEVYENAILVSVNEDEDVRRSSDLISVSLDVQLEDSMTHFTVGDRVIVYYNGEIAESYPAQVNTVYAILMTSLDIRINMDDLFALSSMGTAYVGDNSAVGGLLGALPRIDREHSQRFFSIGDDYGTGNAPYTLTLYYEPGDAANDAEAGDVTDTGILLQNSALLFSLIDNLEEISYAFRATPGGAELNQGAYTSRVTYSRNEISGYLETIGLTWEAFRDDWNGSVEMLYTASPVAASRLESLTLEDVRTLAQKGDELVFEDFQQYEGVNAGSSMDYYIMVYNVEGSYRLIVRSNQSGKPDSVSLENIWESSGSGIDIRYEDIDEFLSKRPVIMQAKDGTATPSGVTLALENVTSNEYTYGEDYTVQRKTDYGWTDVVPVLDNYGFEAIGYVLSPMGSNEIMVDWEWLYGKLPAGDYRIVKEAHFLRSPGDFDRFTLYAAFTIAE